MLERQGGGIESVSASLERKKIKTKKEEKLSSEQPKKIQAKNMNFSTARFLKYETAADINSRFEF